MPPDLRVALTEKVLPTLPAGPFWECAAGDGYLADAIAATGREVIASDIAPQRRGITRLDFLNDPPPNATRGRDLGYQSAVWPIRPARPVYRAYDELARQRSSERRGVAATSRRDRYGRTRRCLHPCRCRVYMLLAGAVDTGHHRAAALVVCMVRMAAGPRGAASQYPDQKIRIAHPHLNHHGLTRAA